MDIDTAVVKRARKGDSEAFEEILKANYQLVFNVVSRIVPNPQDAVDVCQNVFINAYRKISSFEGKSAITTWLYRIAVNEAISFRRSRRLLSISSVEKEDSDGDAFVPVVNTDVKGTAEQDELKVRVKEAIDKLEDEDRVVLMLREYGDLDYTEIAQIVGIPVGTVRSRLHRAREQLKEILKPYFNSINQNRLLHS